MMPAARGRRKGPTHTLGRDLLAQEYLLCCHQHHHIVMSIKNPNPPSVPASGNHVKNKNKNKKSPIEMKSPEGAEFARVEDPAYLLGIEAPTLLCRFFGQWDIPATHTTWMDRDQSIYLSKYLRIPKNDVSPKEYPFSSWAIPATDLGIGGLPTQAAI